MAKPTVAIRVSGELYDDLVEIADGRDVTITQALDIYIRRQSRPKGVRPKLKAKPKPEAKHNSEPEPEVKEEPKPIEPTTKSIVPEPEWSWTPSFGGKRGKCGKCGKHILTRNQASHEKVCKG